MSRIIQTYLDTDRKEIEFFNDIILLAKYLFFIPQESNYLLKIGDGTELMHNKIAAQILYEYSQFGYQVDSIPKNYLLPKRHDFNVGEYRCEVKTIQSLGKLEKTLFGRMRLTEDSASSLLQGIIDDVEIATKQVGKEGIIILSRMVI